MNSIIPRKINNTKIFFHLRFWKQIAEWLNNKSYLSVRGKKFKSNHVHSIVKKKRLKDEKLERAYPEVRSDLSLDLFDKTLVNMFEGL